MHRLRAHGGELGINGVWGAGLLVRVPPEMPPLLHQLEDLAWKNPLGTETTPLGWEAAPSPLRKVMCPKFFLRRFALPLGNNTGKFYFGALRNAPSPGPGSSFDPPGGSAPKKFSLGASRPLGRRDSRENLF